MKNPTPFAIIILGTALVFCLSFIHEEDAKAVLHPVVFDTGRVLGVSEVAADTVLDAGLYNLPDAEERRPSGPSQVANVRDLSLGSCSALVMDTKTGKILYAQDSDKIRPIASITKLMTALVFLDHNPGWDTYHIVEPKDRLNGGRVYVYKGEKILVRDLFHLSLVASANTATQALMNSTGLSAEEYMKAMNQKAKELGLENTSFIDGVGFSTSNRSTAKEIAKLLKVALDKEEIALATQMSNYSFVTRGGRKGIVNSTNYLVDNWEKSAIDYEGGKTGHTDAAGYCFTGAFMNSLGNGILSVVLGANSPSARFGLTEKMMQWTYASYIWN